MNRRVQLLLIGILVVAVFMSMASSARANEPAPPVNSPAAAAAGQGSVSGEGAQIAMDPNAVAILPTDSFDFGSVYEGNDVFHDFIVKNEGTADLKIINVKSG